VGLDWVTPLYRSGAAIFRTLPRAWSEGLASTTYRVVSTIPGERRTLVERNLLRATDGELRGPALRRAVSATYQSYGHYWVDSFRLPRLTPAEVDAVFAYEGVGHMIDAHRAGKGQIIVLPHLGGWEWAAFWVAQVLGIEVTAVVEPVEPPELFDFFTAFRESIGIHPVPLGPGVASTLLRALNDNHMVCLLADRDIEGSGIEVDFFGERTTLPAGPATLALRSGAPLIPSAIYFGPGAEHYAVVQAPLDVSRREKRLRADVTRITQDVADALEGLIRRAPEQWHLQQPNWPSDTEALMAARRR
jgi:KDO2-lipid IV(A) lauroyltransferase